MPVIQRMYEEMEGREDVQILAWNAGVDSEARVRGYWESSGFGFEAVLDPGGRAARALGVIAYPTNIVVGPDGTVLYARLGFDERSLRRILGLAPS